MTGLSNDSLVIKSTENKSQNRPMELYQTKEIVHSNKENNQQSGSTQQEKTLANHTSDMRIITKIYVRNSSNSVARKQPYVKIRNKLE